MLHVVGAVIGFEQIVLDSIDFDDYILPASLRLSKLPVDNV